MRRDREFSPRGARGARGTESGRLGQGPALPRAWRRARMLAEVRLLAPHALDVPRELLYYDAVQRVFLVQRCLVAVCRLGIPDLLASGPMSVDEMAARTGSVPSSLLRVLRVLATDGVLGDVGEGTFALTSRGSLLVSTEAHSTRFRFVDDLACRSTIHLAHAVVGGEVPFELEYGRPFWDHLDTCSEDREAYLIRIRQQGELLYPALIAAYDRWRDATHVVDVGGGDGRFLAMLLGLHSHLTGALLDRSTAEAEASPGLLGELTSRCDIVAGDARESVPAGGDLYVLARLLDGFTDDDCARILGAVRRAALPTARVLIVELLLEPASSGSEAAFRDLEAFLLHGDARERTLGTYRSLLGNAGFDVNRVLPTATSWTIIEATPRR
jgi:O-methyltransferase domain